ncbi:hypothetical protein [Sorangium sp. So ce124]|uniref:hypothetical protein n=1 Tax=Sorangium sp. So ce124 TaxID=3133280 RepID=UPI003F5DDA97
MRRTPIPLMLPERGSHNASLQPREENLDAYPTTAEVKLPNIQPQRTEAMYLAADESLMQFVVDYYYRRYDEFFEQEGTLPDLGVSYLYSIPESPMLNLAPLPPQVQAGRSNTLCTVDTIHLALTFPGRKLQFIARADILATCAVAGPRLIMKVDKAVATTQGEVDPVATQVLDRVVVPALVKWLERLLIPELTQGLGDIRATLISAQVEDDQINGYARVFGGNQATAPGAAIPRTDLTPIEGAGRVRLVAREDAINMAFEGLVQDPSWKEKEKASYSVFSGEAEVKATVYSPNLEISEGKVTCTMRVKAYAKVSGKVAGIGESIKLDGECVLKPVVRLERLDGDARAAINLDVKRSDVDIKLEGSWGPLDFARKSLNKTVGALLDAVLDQVARYASNIQLVAFDMNKLAKSAGLDVAIGLDELSFKKEMLCWQFTLRERS